MKECICKEFESCKTCRKRKSSKIDRDKYPDRTSKSRIKYNRKNHIKILLRGAKYRAELKSKPFTITEKDIFVPDKCPILDIPLFTGDGKLCANSPTLDEILPGLGYIPNNVQVISSKANTMKSNATIYELKLFAKWVMEQYGA